MSLTVTFFIPPNGETTVQEITKVYLADADFFKQHNVKISMEELLIGEQVVYADTGKVTEGEPDELIVFAAGRSCEDTLRELRQACEKRFNEEGWPS